MVQTGHTLSWKGVSQEHWNEMNQEIFCWGLPKGKGVIRRSAEMHIILFRKLKWTTKQNVSALSIFYPEGWFHLVMKNISFSVKSCISTFLSSSQIPHPTIKGFEVAKWGLRNRSKGRGSTVLKKIKNAVFSFCQAFLRHNYTGERNIKICRELDSFIWIYSSSNTDTIY